MEIIVGLVFLERDVQFRTADGRCNHLEETNYGRAGTPLQRILDPSYGGNAIDFRTPRRRPPVEFLFTPEGQPGQSGQSIHAPRASVRTAGNGLALALPSARQVSTAATSEENRLSSDHTVLVMQMGQVRPHEGDPYPTDRRRVPFVLVHRPRHRPHPDPRGELLQSRRHVSRSVVPDRAGPGRFLICLCCLFCSLVRH